MKTELEGLIDFLAMRADPETEARVRQALQDPESELARAARAMQEAMRDPFHTGQPLFGHGEMAAGEEQPAMFPLPRPSNRPRMWQGWPIPAAVAASLLLGVLLGSLLVRWWSAGREGPVVEADLVASTQAEFVRIDRGGPELILRLTVTSDRPGFVAVVGLTPERRPEVLPGLGQDFLRVSPAKSASVESLNLQTAYVLTVVTETPAAELVRRLLSSGELLGPEKAKDAQERLRTALEAHGHRRFSLTGRPITPP